MKIGIDAKWYFEGPPSGRRVVRALTDALLQLDDRNEYVIFLDSRFRKEKFYIPQGRKATCEYIWAGNNLLSNLFVLPRASARSRVDVLLCQNFVSPLGTRQVAYIHDVLFLSHPQFYTLIERIYFSPLRFLTRFARRVITVSEEEKKRLVSHHFGKPAIIDVIHHGVDPGFHPLPGYPVTVVEEIKQRYKLPDRFILFVGRLNLRKNVENLLRALPLMKDQLIPLVIVGADDWKQSAYRKIVEDLRLSQRVHFTGAIHSDLGIVYALSTLFCFPSHAESFGLPPLEAMASGVPIVVSNTTSLPEVCGEAGTYINPESPSEIAHAIDNLLSNGQLYDQKRALGLKQASKFTWQATAARVIETMKSATA